MNEDRDADRSRARVLPVPRAISIISLSRSKVTNMKGDDLGRIEDFMVDLETGRIAFAVLAVGGIISRETKLYAIPWEALSVSLHDKKFILNINREALENAPGFNKNTWPDLSNLSWLRQVYNYYGYEPFWKD